MPHDPTEQQGDWFTQRSLVLYRLESIESLLETINKRLSAMEIASAAGSVRAGMWGAIAGGLPSLIVAAFLYYKNV